MTGAARDPTSQHAPASGVGAGPIQSTPTTAFGKYQLFASLGRGGMADVFLAVARGQMGFNKLAVIKRLRQALAEEPAFRTMFLDEARLAARLNHPNIVHTYEVGEQSGVYFIAMEYLEGQALNKILKEALRRNEALEPEISIRIVADALAGLHHAHELRDYDGRPLSIIHRDISPHNIFVTYDGHTKLVDFGIAKAALSSTETEVGVLKGKVAYMSPEQAMGTRIDCRSDLFAMGIVLWELIARQRLMTGESAANTLHKLMNEPIPRLSQAVPGIDPMLDAIVARSLEKDPNGRFQNAAEMRDALEQWLASRPRAPRQEDVGRRLTALFGHVREEVQRQIQHHMGALTTASTTQELQALTADSIRRMELSGSHMSGQLLRLAGTTGSGSGSGVVPNYSAPPGSSNSPMFQSLGTQSLNAQPPRPNNNPLLITIAIGCFLLAGLMIVVIGFRDRHPSNPNGNGETQPIPTAPVLASDIDASAPLAPQVGTPGNGAPVAPVSAAPTSIKPPPTHHSNPGPVPGPTSKIQNTTPAAPTSPRSATQPVAPPPPPPPAEEPGFLTISSYPWSKVSEGGKVVCSATPCSKVQMTPGNHTLVFENAEQGLKYTMTVSIKSGETKSVNPGLK